MKILLELFKTFASIGGVTFGGGYAMLPMLEREIVDNKNWVTSEELLDYYAVGQATPGIIAVNVATFVGYKTKGILGAIFATLGMIFPSLIIIMIIASTIKNSSQNVIVQHALNGIRVAVSVLVFNAIYKLYKSSVKDNVGMWIFILTFILGIVLTISPIYIVISAIIFGIAFRHREEI